jgi:hypothetical protein
LSDQSVNQDLMLESTISSGLILLKNPL